MKRRFLTAGLLLLLLAPTAPAADLVIEPALRDVERIRGLKFRQQVRTASIPRAKLAAALREQIAKSLPYSFDDYLLILESLRLVEPGTRNAEALLLDLMEEQVLAFYDPMSHVYVAINEPPKGVPEAAKQMGFEHAVAVHELMHALQDQQFGIGPAELALRKDTDASLAYHSVVEGEASLVMLARLVEPMGQTLDGIVKNAALASLLAGASTMVTGGADTPRYFTESLALPYTAGLKFVMAVYRKGGWEAVNRLYADPPASMREVLHPEEYLAGKRTRNPFSLAPPLPVHHLLSVEHLGEWHWQFMLGPEGGRGWKGDRVTIAQDWFCRPTILVETLWESPQAAAAFSGAYAAFLKKHAIDAEMRTEGVLVRVGYGADPVLVSRFLARNGGVQ